MQMSMTTWFLDTLLEHFFFFFLSNNVLRRIHRSVDLHLLCNKMKKLLFSPEVAHAVVLHVKCVRDQTSTIWTGSAN